MPVIINDFEVVSETPADPPPTQGEDTPAPSGLRPADVIQIHERHRRRQLRLRAH